MIKVVSLIFLFCFLACCCNQNNVTIYSYNDIVVKRIDYCSKTVFQYFESTDNNSYSYEIFAKYSGINDGFSGYLKFYDSGKVQILSGDGAFFLSEEMDTTIFNYKRIVANQRPNIGHNVCYISLAREIELKINSEKDLLVKIDYQ